MSFVDNLPDDIKDIFQKEQIECPKVVLHSSETCLEKLKLSKSQIKIAKEEAARSMNINFTNFYELLKDPVYRKRLSFGCKNLDDLTDGGLLAKGVTEIHGEAGSGKTLILLQLSLMVQLPENLGGFNKRAIYICTECKFPSRRLYQLIEAFKEKYPEQNEIKYGENIFVKHAMFEDHLLKCVLEDIPNLMKTNQIGLIVIDSIAGVFRNESNYIERATALRKIVRTLSHLIDEYKCVVVCSNQVASKMQDGKQDISPCLGVTWSHLIVRRIKISKFIEKTEYDNLQQLRQFELIFAPDSGYKECKFQITSKGIVDFSSNSS